MNGGRTVSGMSGRTIEARDEQAGRPPSAASKTDAASAIRPGASAFIWMETLYLVLQFGVFGLIIGIVDRGRISD